MYNIYALAYGPVTLWADNYIEEVFILLGLQDLHDTHHLYFFLFFYVLGFQKRN